MNGQRVNDVITNINKRKVAVMERKDKRSFFLCIPRRPEHFFKAAVKSFKKHVC